MISSWNALRMQQQRSWKRQLRRRRWQQAWKQRCRLGFLFMAIGSPVGMEWWYSLCGIVLLCAVFMWFYDLFVRCDQLADRIADGEEFFLGYIKKSVDKCRIRCYYRQAVAWDTGSNLRSNGDREAWKLYRCTILMERVCEVRREVCWEAESFLKKLFQKTSKNLLTKRKRHDIITKLSRKRRPSTKERSFQ